MKKETYYVNCPTFCKRAVVDVYRREYKNPQNVSATPNYSGIYCHLTSDGCCPLIDPPCVSNAIKHSPP